MKKGSVAEISLEPKESTPEAAHPVNNAHLCHLSSANLPHGWQLHYFASVDPVATRSWLATVIAVVTDGFFPESDGVRYSLAICVPIIYLLAALCYWRAIHHFRDHLKALGES